MIRQEIAFAETGSTYWNVVDPTLLQFFKSEVGPTFLENSDRAPLKLLRNE